MGVRRARAIRPTTAAERGIPAALADILCATLSVEESELTLDTVLTSDLGADSLDVIEVQLAIERRYHVSAEDDWIDEDRPPLTVGAIVTELRNLGAKL